VAGRRHSDAARRKTIYCVIPRDLAGELHDYLREAWRDDDTLIVVVERRRGERRQVERRCDLPSDAQAPERRRIPGLGGRRVAERRLMSPTSGPADLPAKARPHAHRLQFVERLAPSGRAAEDRDANRLVVRIQGGDTAAFDELYLAYFDRVYAYARVALRDPHEGEDVAQQVFASVVQALPRYRVRDDVPFRAWLFRITRNTVLRALSRTGRLRPEEPAELDRRLESPTPELPTGLDWLSDSDLAMFVERLPLSQRQVILLRYVFDFTTDEIGRALERSPVAIRMLEHRAMRALEARLHALRGSPHGGTRSSMVALTRPLPVLVSRRLALHSPGGPLV
jgi:RNA polymerase sigma-70 factor (ECF subfamily)